jgi:phosphohistidine swiveling domain-containing protein
VNPPLLIDLRSRRLPSSLGGKAANLRRLIDGGFRVPVTFVIPWEAYERCLLHDPNLMDELAEELEPIIDPTKTYAVRSSANIEDSLEQSFAGQFMTCLDMRGITQIRQAVQTVWDSAAADNVQQYLDRIPGLQQDLKMGVIIQEMVNPQISGVAFSRNPMTGAAETVVEAVEGSGLRLVQDGCTPHRWIHKWGRWVAQPEDGTFPLHIIQQVVDGVAAIARYLKNPVDLEWVYDGETLYWVQVREITTLKDLNIFSNRISREVLPGQIKPLIWSINIPLVISQWIKLLSEMIGKNDLKPDELARQFHYYAYFNMGALGRIFNTAGFPSEGLEMMMGIVPKEAGRPAFRFNPASLRLAPRMLWFMLQKWTMEANYKKGFPALEREIQEISLEGLAQWSEAELCERINCHFELLQRTAWYNIHIPILMNMYSALLSRQLQKQGIQSEQLDLMAEIPEAGVYDPERSLRHLNRQYRDLPGEMQAQISNSSYSDFLSLPGIEPFQASVSRFIKKFGHFSDSGNDFSVAPWREQPELILRMSSAYEPQISFSDQLLQLKDIKQRSPTLRLFYGRTRRFRLYREQVSYQYTYAYGLFRDLFHALGDRLVIRSLLDDWQDIFYLNWEEVQSLALSGDDPANPARCRVADRRAEMEHSHTAELPTVIYGDQAPPIIPFSSERMTGTPTSPGYYSGCVRLVHGIQHFSKVQPGDVLVIPYSDVGWTPLFARAGAVIAESGGILSHSSIVAREYRIPAVLSVDGAMQRLKDGQVVTVDGYKGEVILHKESNQRD